MIAPNIKQRYAMNETTPAKKPLNFLRLSCINNIAKISSAIPTKDIISFNPDAVIFSLLANKPIVY